MVSFITSVVVTLLMLAVVVVVGMRRDPKTPLSWGEAFVAATWIFFLMLMAYAIVPNQFLIWADSELNWRKDAFFFGESGLQVFGRGRILFPKEALRDIIATNIYVVFAVINVKGWRIWQERGTKKPSTDVETSPFGRPLQKAAAQEVRA